MKFLVLSRFALLGAGLALMLQTQYRIAGPLGPGELLTAAFIILNSMGRAISSRSAILRRPDNLTIHFVAIVFLIVTPVTLMSSVSGLQGTNFVDLFAYYFICAILLNLPRSDKDAQLMVTTFMVVMFITVIAQYLFGGSNAYYSFRFTGGAQNPNQLGLYLVSALVLLIYVPWIWARIFVTVLAVFFGIATQSDAFLAAVLVQPLVLSTLIILPPRAAVYFLPAILIFGFIGLLYTGLLDYLSFQWENADQGGTRIMLYISAIEAWLDTPVSFMVGHGAGSFSGFDGPFQKAEAHNTALDMASTAGIFGLLLFPLIPVYFALSALRQNLRLAPAMILVLVVYASFHFVGRQPLFWVALVMVERSIRVVPMNLLRPTRRLASDKEARA